MIKGADQVAITGMAEPCRPRKRLPKIRKVAGRSLEVDGRSVAALLAMHRCRDISADHAAMAMGLSSDSARVRLRDLHRYGLVAIIRPKMTRNSGNRPHQYGLKEPGYEVLVEHLAAASHCDDEIVRAMIGKFSPPLKRVWPDILREHRIGTIDAIVSLERSAAAYPSLAVERAIPEFRRDEKKGTCHPTADLIPGTDDRLKFDAIAVVRGELRRLIAIENDTGSMGIYQIDAKLRRHWDYLASGKAAERFCVDDPVFATYFVTTSRKRIGAILSGIAWQTYPQIQDAEHRPIGPGDVFHFTTREDMIGDFFGLHCACPGLSGFHSIFDVAEATDRAA